MAALLPYGRPISPLSVSTPKEEDDNETESFCTDDALNFHPEFFTKKEIEEEKLTKSTQGRILAFETNGQKFAKKIMKLEESDWDEMQVYNLFENEIRVLKHLQKTEVHPHIVHLIASECVETTNVYISLVTPRALGNMTTKDFTPTLDSFEQIARGLDFLKRKLVVHRDIKPENILVYEHGRMCIADFGIAEHLASPEAVCTDQVGVAMYMSPARVEGVYSFASDRWSLGVIIAQFVRWGAYTKLPCPFDEDSCVDLNSFFKTITYIKEQLKDVIDTIRRDTKHVQNRELMDLAWECVSEERPVRYSTPVPEAARAPTTPPPTPEGKRRKGK